jgi:hypothetical protein
LRIGRPSVFGFLDADWRDNTQLGNIVTALTKLNNSLMNGAKPAHTQTQTIAQGMHDQLPTAPADTEAEKLADIALVNGMLKG